MKENPGKGKQISRRGLFPLLGSMLVIPFLGLGNPINNEILNSEEEDEKYETLLKPDGTTVKVKVSTLKKAKVVKNNLSNRSMFKWLRK